MRTFSRPLWALRNALAPAYRIALRTDGWMRYLRNRRRVALASFPRSGNTWMRDLLETVTSEKTGSIYPFDPVNAGRPRGSGIVIKSHETDSYLYGRAIYLVRDPFDAIASFFKYRRDIEGYTHLTWEKHLPWATRKWKQHTEHWLNANCPTLRISYEQIHDNPAEQLRKALHWLGRDADDQAIDDAVAQCGLDQLRERYRRDLGQRAERFFRQGRAGTGRDAFTPEQIAYVEQQLGDLMDRLGYSQPGEPASVTQTDPAEPKVTIITPTYNHAEHLGDAIDSVLAQDWPNLELIVMDGGSTDHTVELLKTYGDRITWVSEPDEGQSDAINKGIARSTGSLITWLNADDMLLPGAVRAAAEFMREHPRAGLVYGNADFVNRDGHYICPCAHIEPYDLNKLIHFGDFIVQPASFFTREAFDAVGGIDPDLNWGMDWDLFIRIGKRFDIHHLPRTLAEYRWLGASKTASGGLARLEEVTRIGIRHGSKGRPAYFRLEAASFHVTDGKQALRDRHFAAAIKEFLMAMREIFSSFRTIRCLLRPHVWRTYFAAKKLHSAVDEDAA